MGNGLRVKAWVDGAIMNNGNKNGSGVATGGVGVVLPGEDDYRLGRAFIGPTDSAEPGAVTNNRMELEAVLEAMRIVIRESIDCGVLEVMSDSAYVVNGWIKHLPKWMKRGWKTAEGSPVKNQDLWRHMIELNAQLMGRDCRFELTKVKGHSGNKHNEEADVLAVEASKRKPRSLRYERTAQPKKAEETGHRPEKTKTEGHEKDRQKVRGVDDTRKGSGGRRPRTREAS